MTRPQIDPQLALDLGPMSVGGIRSNELDWWGTVAATPSYPSARVRYDERSDGIRYDGRHHERDRRGTKVGTVAATPRTLGSGSL